MPRALVLAAALLLGVPAVSVRAEEGARRTVEELNRVIVSVLADAERLGYGGRAERLRPAMERAFNFDFMAEKSLGRHWKDLDDAQRKTWRDLFAEFTVANYAANLDRPGATFAVTGVEPDVHDTVLVKSVVTEPAGEAVDLAYRLQRAGDAWRIVDVQVKGTVSELALRRADFTSVIARDGFDALTETVRARIADLAAGRGKRPPA